MEEQRPVWVQPGRITDIVTRSGGGYLVTIRSTTVRFAARNLNQREVVQDLTLLIIMSNEDTDLVYYTVELESLPDHVQIGDPVMVEVDEEDDHHVIHLHPDALYQEPYLPDDMHLLCPVEHQGRWRRQGDEAVYECPCRRDMGHLSGRREGEGWDIGHTRCGQAAGRGPACFLSSPPCMAALEVMTSA